MAASASGASFLLGPVNYEISEVVKFQGHDCIIVNITNELGFNKYHLIDLDTGMGVKAFIHQLDKRAMDGQVITIIDGNGPSETASVPDATPEPETPARFARLSDEDLQHKEIKSLQTVRLHGESAFSKVPIAVFTVHSFPCLQHTAPSGSTF